MVFIVVIFIVVAVITAVVSTTVSRFTNKTLDNVMKQIPKLEEQATQKVVYRQEPEKGASDKDIIDVAVANNGKVTATILCARLDISIDEATTKLEHLHNKGIFTLDNTESGHLVYMLVDLDLMR